MLPRWKQHKKETVKPGVAGTVIADIAVMAVIGGVTFLKNYLYGIMNNNYS